MFVKQKHTMENMHIVWGDGGHPSAHPPNFLIFVQCFGKLDKTVCWRPPTGNPGSAPDVSSESMEHFKVNYSKVLLIFYQQDFPVSIKFFRHDKFWMIWK